MAPLPPAPARRRVHLIPLLLLVFAILAIPAEASARRTAATPFFGVSGARSASGDYDLMQSAGVGTYRVLFHFRAAKREDGIFYDWSAFDDLVARTSNRGIDLLPLLYGTPDWIAADEATPPLSTEEARDSWRQLLVELVRRYGPNGVYWTLHPLQQPHPIRSWQIWNEPNDPSFWAPIPSPAAYAELVRISEQAIHSVDPGARIIGAGVVAAPTGGIRGSTFLRHLMAQPGMTEALDAVAYHPYARTVTGVRNHLTEARAALERSGAGSIPIWVTEVGWGSSGTLLRPLIKSKLGQALALRRTFSTIAASRAALGVERVLWYHWRDRWDPYCLWCRSAGLLTSSGRKKPSFGAFRTVAAGEMTRFGG